MRVIGITGSIACGKSTVTSYLSSLGYPVVDGDVLSRALTAPGGRALPAIRDTFGPEFFLPDGSLNRRALGSLVFSSPRARAALDALMAPRIMEETRAALADAAASGAALCFLSMPLLFEKGYDALCDSVWCVSLPPDVQLRRLMARDHLSEPEARARIAAQLSSEEKAARSTFVLDNSSTPEALLNQIPPLLRHELSLAQPSGEGTPRRRRADRYAEPPAPAPAAPDASAAPAAPVTPAPAAPAASAPVIDRSGAPSRRTRQRKAAWAMPRPLAVTLCTLAALLAVAFTAQCLMNAYLARRADEHLAEQRAVDAAYPLSYREEITARADEYNLSPAFVTAIIRNESSFRPRAESGAGARGLMQLMPDTAEWIARKLSLSGYAFERMYDPDTNIRFGCWYLAYLSRLFGGDTVCVACAYHAGQGTVTAWLSDPVRSPDGVSLSLPSLPDGPTKQYAERVSRDYGIYLVKTFSSSAAGSDDPGALPADSL